MTGNLIIFIMYTLYKSSENSISLLLVPVTKSKLIVVNMLIREYNWNIIPVHNFAELYCVNFREDVS
jgi:hypothetical protein